MPVVEVNSKAVEIVQTGSGRNLVMLHSLLADRSAFDRVAPELAKTYRVTLVNLPGYGASAPHGASIEDYADHIAALMRALKLPRDTAVLGNGLGGFITLMLAGNRLPVRSLRNSRCRLRHLASKPSERGGFPGVASLLFYQSRHFVREPVHFT